MVEITPVHPVGWDGMKKHWWQFVGLFLSCIHEELIVICYWKVIIGVLVMCILTGLLYALWSTALRVYRYYHVSRSIILQEFPSLMSS